MVVKRLLHGDSKDTMYATHCRPRTPDALAAPAAVPHLCQCLLERFTELIPKTEKRLLQLLLADRHVERRLVTDMKRGRPGHWRREDLIKVASDWRALLRRETGGRISPFSFTGWYLRVLRFPSDFTDALSPG